MPIPDFIDGVLPEGIYGCTFSEVKERFGRFQKSDRRLNLTDKLEQYLKAARSSGIVAAVVIDGSYVTVKDEPEDIDLLVVLDPAFDFTQELRPFQENVIDKKAVKREYKFDAFAYPESSEKFVAMLNFFMDVAPKHSGWTGQLRKGILRVVL